MTSRNVKAPMTLSGSRLGSYEILSGIGAGGMGEVYRARDTKLERDVALKVLPVAFRLDPDRLARFTREAHVLAALNHPNIAAIYGFEESDGIQALVLELVEGPTLADRIAQGPMPIDEALPIARQIAEALDAAHEKGIIHRDLKPANIKLRADGVMKVLDFGLATSSNALVTNWQSLTSYGVRPAYPASSAASTHLRTRDEHEAAAKPYKPVAHYGPDQRIRGAASLSPRNYCGRRLV